MNIRKIMNETLIANNGEMSRGLKDQLNILPMIADNTLDDKVALLKKQGISFYSYQGLRTLAFTYDNLLEVINNNTAKIDIYRTNPQELVKDLRANEKLTAKSSLDADVLGGM